MGEKPARSVEQTVRRSLELFHGGFCCSESVLLASTERLGLQSELVPRIATGFCGGMAHAGSVCGAVSGAVMALGCVQGRDVGGAPREAIFASVQQLAATFRERWGSIDCPVLLGCDLGTEEGQRRFREQDLKTQRCDRFVEEAVRVALERIDD